MQITLSSAVSANVPFAVGFAFKQGHIPSGQTIGAGATSVQATVKNRWPDGSAKFAIIAGVVPAVAGVSQAIGLQAAATGSAGTALSTADLRATGITAGIDCGTFGAVSWSGSDWDSPTSSWISGAVLSSWIYRKPVGSDRHLVAWLEVRLFRDGSVDVLPWVENGYLNVTGPSNKVADYKFTVNGAQRFAARIDLPNHCRTPLISGTGLSHWLGSDPGVVAYCDADYLQATELVPTYFAEVPPTATVVAALPSSFTPLQRGSLPDSMGSTGYHPSIGLLPEWDVLFLSSIASQTWAALQRNAYSTGRYGIHHRDETTNRPPRFSSYPTTVLGEGAAVYSIGSSSTGTYTPNATGTAPADWAVTHQPSVGYMAYLLTGRWYHMETVQFAAITNHFLGSTAPRQNADGIMQTWAAKATRGAAWCLRTLGQAACITPDADTPLRTEFLTSFAANINTLHATYASNAQGSLGFMQPFSNYTAAVYQNAGAASTSTNIVLPGGTSTDGEYALSFSNGSRWTVTIGGQTRNITAWAGSSFTATVSPAFTVATAGQPSELHSGHWYEAPWMQDFYTGALGYTKCLGLALDASTLTKFDEFFAWKAKSVVGRFGGVGPTEYLYRDAASYSMAIAESETWTAQYSDWGKIWTDTRLYNVYGNNLKEIGDGSLRGTVSASSFWGNLQPALAYAVRFSVPGASAALALMRGAPNWATVMAPDFNSNPVWSVRSATP